MSVSDVAVFNCFFVSSVSRARAQDSFVSSNKSTYVPAMSTSFNNSDPRMDVLGTNLIRWIRFLRAKRARQASTLFTHLDDEDQRSSRTASLADVMSLARITYSFVNLLLEVENAC